METRREPPDAEKQACFHQVVNRFPDICTKFLGSVVGPLGYKAERVINHIIERQSSGDDYPKEQNQVVPTLEEGSVGDGLIQQQRLFTDPNRPAERAGSLAFEMTKMMLAGDFPYIPMKSLVEILSNHKNHLYPAYIAILEIYANNIFRGVPLQWDLKQYPSPLSKRYEGEAIVATLSSTQDPTEGSLIIELLLCRLIKGEQSLRLFMLLSTRRRDAISLQQAMASGRVFECEGCFAEHPLNRLIHCDGEHPHLFCPRCCGTAAQTQISQSKHDLRCISIEDCSAGFSVGERIKYLSADQIKALDRIAKEAEVEQNGHRVQ